MDNYNYPIGSDTEDAPWNDKLSEIYDWIGDWDYDEEPDPLDRYYE